jgi:tetratricopeptide (TPR) repeat protein
VAESSPAAAPEPEAAPPRSAPPRIARRAVSDDPLSGIGGGGAPSGNLRPRPAMRAPIAAAGAPGRVLATPPAHALAEPSIANAMLVPSVPPIDGALREVDDLIRHHNFGVALAKARGWREQDPGDVMALVALGECGEASGDLTIAARAYGSIIDLFPGRADMRRFAGERLERVHGAASLALAVDTYRKAVEQRPDHPASHRLLAFALLKQGRPREAFQAIAAGAGRRYPDGRFAGVDRILREDLGLVAAAWMRAEPARASEIRAQLERAHGAVENAPSVRFVLNWETDANDVDFHIHDGRGGHAYYASRQLASGGELYADVTTGYGPECFTIRGPAAGRAFPYTLQAHYYSRGPMGYGMGKLQVIEHDGHGGLHFDERPFVIMRDGAFVDLGTIKGSAFATAAAIATSH